MTSSFGKSAVAQHKFTLVEWANRAEVQAAWKELAAKYDLLDKEFRDIERIFSFTDAALWYVSSEAALLLQELMLWVAGHNRFTLVMIRRGRWGGMAMSTRRRVSLMSSGSLSRSRWCLLSRSEVYQFESYIAKQEM